MHGFTYTKPSGSAYSYYKCPRGRRYEGSGPCDGFTVRAERIEEFVAKTLADMSRDRAFLADREEMLRELRRQAEESGTGRDKELARLRKQEQDLSARREALLDALERRAIDDSIFGERYRKLTEQLEDNRVAQTRHRDAAADTEALADCLQASFEEIASFEKNWELLDPQGRASLLQTIVKRIDVTREDVKLWVYLDPAPEPVVAPSRTGAGPFLAGPWLLVALLAAGSSRAGSLADLARPQEGRSMRATSSHRSGPDGKYDPNAPIDPNSNWDNQNVPPGATKVLMNEAGPGVITHIWLTFLGPEPHPWARDGSADHQEMLLRITYDGAKRPGVEAPVGDFFACAFGRRREVISVPVVVEDADSYNCFWHMPFRKSARVEIVNQSAKPISLLYYNIDWIKRDSLPADTPYFHAQYRQEYPVVQGRDYLLLETEGRGHYVGTVLSVRTRSPAWFGEGDEKIYIDGEKRPSIWGTGTEDYFLSAWGLKATGTPYFGTPVFDQWGIVGGHTSAYRWHVQDPIVFQKGIKVTIEHYGWVSPDETPNYKATSWNQREDDYSSVAFWYQTGTPTFPARAPHARERKLPSLDLAFRAAAPDANVTHGAGAVQVQRLLDYPEGQILYKPSEAEGAWIELPFEVKRKQPLRLLLNMTRSYDFGRYQATLNGVRIGGVLDFYNRTTDNWEYHLLDFWPDPGKYTLRLECVGKAPLSTAHWLGLESVRLRERRPRVAAWAHDRDKDWRKTPTLYR